MNPEMIELAKRAVACKGWQWMPGMRVEWVGMDTGWRMLTETRSWYEREGCEDGEPGGPNAVPDLTDPATLGCLLALVRKAWGMPTGIVVSYSSDEGLWGVSWSGATHGGWCGRGKTEAEALVVALENA